MYDCGVCLGKCQIAFIFEKADIGNIKALDH